MSTTSITGWCSTKRDATPHYPPTEVGGKEIWILSYGDRIACGEYRLHSRFTRAINFVCGEHLLCFVDTTVGAGPLNVVLDSIGKLDGVRAQVSANALRIGKAEFTWDDAHRYDSSIAIPPEATPASVESGLAFFKRALRETAPHSSLLSLSDRSSICAEQPDFETGMAGRFAAACRLLREGRLADGVRRIRGLGWGLTPGGDDFICGMLIALNLRRRMFGEDTSGLIQEVYGSACSDNLFSAAFLRCAQEGRVFQKLKRALTAILRSDRGEIATATVELAALGATSGSDLGAGFVFEMERCEAVQHPSRR